jgi:hypothetical protein
MMNLCSLQAVMPDPVASELEDARAGTAAIFLNTPGAMNLEIIFLDR